MAGDFNKPTGSSLRTAFMQEIRDIVADVAKMIYSGTSNIPTGCIRYNASTKKFESYNGSTWTALDLSLTTIAAATNADTVDSQHAAALLARANHTGTQAIATLSNHNKAAHDALGIAAATADNAYKIFDAGLGFSVGIKTVSMGIWNMDTTASISVAHGLSIGTICGVMANIKGDQGTNLYSFVTPGLITSAAEVECWISMDATNVILNRRTGGTYDSVNYDNVALSRGSITIFYTI